MTRSTLIGCVAGLLLPADGLSFVQNRVALLDIFLALLVTCVDLTCAARSAGQAPRATLR